MDKSPDAFRTISEVAEWLDVPTHVLRFWESRFTQVKPVKRAGGRRYYRPADMELLGGIKRLLHDDGLTIRGVQKLLREQGVKHVAALSPPADSPVGPRSDGDETGSPMAVDVPALPQPGEVVDFVPDTEEAPQYDSRRSKSEPDPDASLSRWPFVDDPDDQAEPDGTDATPSGDVETPEPEAASDSPPEPVERARQDTSLRALLDLVRAAPRAKLADRRGDLAPLVARLSEIAARMGEPADAPRD